MWLPPSFKTLTGCMHLCFQTKITRADFVRVNTFGARVSPLTFVWC